jgi:YidC/Oxa1 family membrane protein insertase
MPWVLMVIMASFAAGLQLYWVTNNILTIAQQRLLYARYPGMKAGAPAAPAAAAATAPPPPPPPPPPASGPRRKSRPRAR